MVPKRPGEDGGDAQIEPGSKRLRGEQADGLPPLQIYPKGLELPSGWLDCPPIGHRIEQLHVVPAKVPLGRRFGQILTEEQHFSPEKLIHQLRAKGLEVGLIIDLTNSWRYYDLEEVESLGVTHLKIMCRGRGKAPEPQAVNKFVWELMNFNRTTPGKWAVVHCTHGYNRTGFMIVSMLMRHGCTLAFALRLFKEHRANGIYKEDYIRTLYQYYHEPLPASFQAPALPAWKPEEPDSPKVDHDLDAEEIGGDREELCPLQHDDDIGEDVTSEQADMVCESIIRQVRNVPEDDAVPDPWRTFPGSQPVSLDRQNLSLLHSERYWVTWKADGTRYMLLIMHHGAYLVDRSFKVRRLQMRFPKHFVRNSDSYQSHHMTLLDGELIVDEDRETGKHTYRYLAYDAMAINGKSLVNCPWKERWQAVENLVLKMRQAERIEIDKDVAARLNRYPVHYQYRSELVRVLQKGFYPLWGAKKLLLDVIPTLSHESDGLIFQAYNEPYNVGTDAKLLKWKYGNMNSVDFLLRSKAAGPELYLGKGSDIVLLPGAKVEFSEGEDVRQYENCIVECSWDGDDGVWRFMRVRTDKQLPNAKHVYEKVLASIKDNIEQEDIISEVEEAMKSSVYERDRLQMPVK